MKMATKQHLLAGISATALSFCFAEAALAQSAPAEVNEVIVTGTRQVGIRAVDSAAPVQSIGAQQLTKTGSVDLATSLSVAVPSFNVNANGGDAAAVHVLAALRGLSPNDTLILVDGKRRHTTSNLAVDSGSVYSGSATTDLAYIPVDAIDHIEVLTDGAAAQYGSDAIAGVINIILKKGSTGGTITGSGGQNYNGVKGAQGQTGTFSYNQGFNIGDKGFINLTGEVRTHNFTTLGIGDIREQSASGAPLPGLTYPSSNIASAPNYPYENRVNGDPESAIYNVFYNSGYELNPSVSLYSFGNLSYNTSQHFENYRVQSKVSGVSTTGQTVYAIPLGFDPKEQFNETDYSFTGGAKGEVSGWNWDASLTYGGNHTQVNVLDTANAALFATLQSASATPVNYPTHTIYDGAFDATELAGNLGVDKAFEVGLAAPVNLALGFEARKDTYGIGAGEPESYYGSGAQSFFGYAPTDAGNYSRTNYAGYIDVAFSPIKKLKIDLAGRFEHYSDFGNASTGKANARYDFNDMIAVRGTVSNGFRAPTLAEEFYSGLNVGPTSVSGQLPPNSSAAISSGFKALQPEKSLNYSAGLVLHPASRLTITLDGYFIDLKSRILPSNNFVGLNAYCVPNGVTVQINPVPVSLTCPAGSTARDVVVSPGVLSAINGRGVSTAGLTNVGIAAFINAINTQTEGLDLTGTYSTDFAEFGHVDWSVGFNYNRTYVTSVAPLPAVVAVTNPALIGLGINQINFLNQISTSQLTTAQPREKGIFQALWNKGKWSVNVRETVYADMSQYAFFPTLNKNVLETIPTTGITDLTVTYRVNKAVKLDVGANNLLNQLPPKTPLGSTGQPIDGSLVYNLPYTWAPWGSNGGYYYGRVTLSF
jgi:iron complex outermembrane receptor protein